jgi:uncharacterized repeat protein (TIGR01451 family)
MAPTRIRGVTSALLLAWLVGLGPAAAAAVTVPAASAAPVRTGADLSATLTTRTSLKIHPGESFSYEVTVANHGPDAARNVRATDSPGFSFNNVYTHRVLPNTSSRLMLKSDKGGPFSFRLVTLKDRRIPAQFGAPISGRLDVPGRVDLYEITPKKQGSLYLSGGHPCDVTVADAFDGTSPQGAAPAEACTPASLDYVYPDKPLVLAVYSDKAALSDYGFTIVAP